MPKLIYQSVAQFVPQPFHAELEAYSQLDLALYYTDSIS